MGAFKKYDGSTWQSINPKKLKGIPYTGTLPATLTGTKAGYLHSYKIFGNTEQTGTPTPENPIVPSECGERAEQLFDVSSITLGKWYTSSGNLQNQAYGAISAMEEINTGQLTIKWHGLKPYSFSYVWFDNNKDFISRSHYGGSSGLDDEYTDTVPTNAVYYILQMSNGTNTSNPITVEQITSFQTMLNAGSTALPYEPYGYKLPLLSGSTPVDIYIGDEPLRKIGDYADYIDYGTGKIVRQVKKLVLNGTENWQKSSTYGGSFLLRNTMDDSTLAAPPLSNLLLYTAQASYTSGSFTITGTQKTLNIWFSQFDAQTTLESFVAYLTERYAVGTPMTIWYVLATPVEEDPPVLFPAIPTSANSTTISWAGQGLAPSEFDSIQEWVDIPTYTRVNGEWVADN